MLRQFNLVSLQVVLYLRQ